MLHGVRRPLSLPLFLVAVLATDARASECTRTSTGLVPLTDLAGRTYKGMTGGLYGAGLNVPPPPHGARGAEAADRVVPRASNGSPDTSGRVGFVSIGMSNTNQEFDAFIDAARRDGRMAPAVVLVNGAQGGVTASEWADPSDGVWSDLDRRLAGSGLTRRQVQVAWVKLANRAQGAAADTYRQQLERDAVNVVRNLRDRFPNLQIAYMSSRIYAGYASSGLNPEPYAYESGFAMKSVISRQMSGQLPGRPWLGWGPYLWADGLRPRGDGLTWSCSDFASDGTHPSAQGRRKVASLLLGFLEANAGARQWFFGDPGGRPDDPPPVDSPADVVVGASDVGEAGRIVIEASVPTSVELCTKSAEGLGCITVGELRERLRARIRD